MKVFQKIIEYNNIRPMILDQLNIIDVLEEMSETEKTEYLKNPTGLNAVLILLKSEERLSEKIDELFQQAIDSVETIIVK